jgi:hypothetical protein
MNNNLGLIASSLISLVQIQFENALVLEFPKLIIFSSFFLARNAVVLEICSYELTLVRHKVPAIRQLHIMI